MLWPHYIDPITSDLTPYVLLPREKSQHSLNPTLWLYCTWTWGLSVGGEKTHNHLSDSRRTSVCLQIPKRILWSLHPLALLGESFTTSFSLWKWKSLSCVDPLQPHRLYSPWNSPGQNTAVGSYSFLQGIFPTQGSNPGLPHCRWILYQLSYQGKPLFSGNHQILFLQISKFTLCWFCVNVTFLFQWESRQSEEGFLTPYHLTYLPTHLHCLLSHNCKPSLTVSI